MTSFAPTLSPPRVSPQALVRVVTRGDDAGSSLSANRAIREACEVGVLRNVSVMAPGPFLEDAFEQLGHLHDRVAFGLHSCLTSEWDFPKWGPVSAFDRVPTLLDAHRSFVQTGQHLHAGGARLEEMVLELEAQLHRVRAVGFRPVYLDEHMGIGWVNGLAEALDELARREDLIYRPALTKLSIGPQPEDEADYADLLVERLRAETEGTFLLVGHPVYDDEEMRAVRSPHLPERGIGADRAGQRMMFLCENVQALFRRHAQAIRYDEI